MSWWRGSIVASVAIPVACAALVIASLAMRGVVMDQPTAPASATGTTARGHAASARAHRQPTAPSARPAHSVLDVRRRPERGVAPSEASPMPSTSRAAPVSLVPPRVADPLEERSTALPAAAPGQAQAPIVWAAGGARNDAGLQNEVTLYGTSWCPYCREARAWLAREHIPFVDIDVEHDARGARLRQLNPRGTVPTFDVRGQIVIGFSPSSLSAALAQAR